MTENSNPIVNVLRDCQNGKLIDTLGAACDLSEAECLQSLERLTPDIARRIGERISDEDDYEDLIDILDEEDQVEILDDPNAMFKRDTIEDGEDILEILYGSMDKARSAARKIGAPKGVDNVVFERLMTMAAALTFSAMARRNQMYQMYQMSALDNPDQQSSGDDGLIAMLWNAMITGFMQGFRQATRRKRRRRRKRSMLEQIFGTKKTKRRRSSRSRKRRSKRKTPSIQDLLGDIFD